MADQRLRTRGSGFRLATIDRDERFVRELETALNARGWGQRAFVVAVPVEKLVAMRLRALVLDLGVLGRRSWAYLELVRAALPGLAIVICSGSGSVADRVQALRLGADDWLPKPCHPDELIARIEAIVRRAAPMAPMSKRPMLRAGELSIHIQQYQAFVGSRSLDLTRRELELLQWFASNVDDVLTREAIYQRVWGHAMARGDRSVDVFVRKLRQKLELVSPGWRYIHTHFGVGYRFAPEREEAEP